MKNKGILTFSQLGSYGHDGNQKFQIAATYGTALDNGMDFIIPPYKGSKYYKKEFKQLSKEEINNFKGPYIDKEGPHHFEPIIIPNVNDNYDIGGYMQSERYFENHIDEVLSFFEPKDEYIDYLKEKYGYLLDQKNCAIHVRRGDYELFPLFHPLSTLNYYQQAMQHFDQDTVYLVFSNDLDWCRGNFIGSQFHFIDECDKSLSGDIYLEQILMSLCQNIITANSTFSLWAAILGKHFYHPNMKIISPSQWFGPALAGHQLHDMYIKDSIII